MRDLWVAWLILINPVRKSSRVSRIVYWMEIHNLIEVKVLGWENKSLSLGSGRSIAINIWLEYKYFTVTDYLTLARGLGLIKGKKPVQLYTSYFCRLQDGTKVEKEASVICLL